MTESTEDTLVGTGPVDPRAATRDPEGGSRSASARGAPASIDRGALVGRYVVLSQLGAGAMGVVLAAYDPELDRKVALKILKHRGDDEFGQARLQREAQALAKLNHTNVVAVHDVGVHAGQVFVAMEFVAGNTLTDWLSAKRPDWRGIVRVFEAAGRGLSAAHAEGLIHRDFKPDNVMIGDDGRPRVMDFGLARAEGDAARAVPLEELETTERDTLSTPLTRTGALMGTPAYMAPEQYAGAAVTPRSDQFAFCVALHEALYGVRPFAGETPAQLAFAMMEGRIVDPPRGAGVPAWLRRIVLRGLAVTPEDRFASMDALLAALESGEGKRGRVRLAAGAGVLAAVTAAIVGAQRLDVARSVARCEAEADAIGEVWTEDTKKAVQAGILATGTSYAAGVAERVPGWIDRQANAWREAARTACTHHTVDHTWDDGNRQRALWCLEERRLELAALVDGLSSADATGVQSAVLAAADLTPVDPCVDERVLATMPLPPDSASESALAAIREGLSRAAYLEASGLYEEGLAAARDARARAQDLGWIPLLASTRAAEGRLLESMASYAEGYEASKTAYLEAAGASDWNTAAAAAGDAGFVLGARLNDHEGGREWFEHAAMAIAHLGDQTGLREVARLGQLGDVSFTASAYDEAMEHYQQALEVTEREFGEDHPRAANIAKSIGDVHVARGEYEQALASFERAGSLAEAGLGEDHPVVASHLHALGHLYGQLGRNDEAKAVYARVIEIRERALGSDHPVLGNSINNLGMIHYHAGEIDQARALYLRALEIFEGSVGAGTAEMAEVYNNLAILDYTEDHYDDAEQRWLDALAIREKVLGPDHVYVGTVLGNLAEVYGLTGRFEDARRVSERALAIGEQNLGKDHPKLGFALSALGAAESQLGEHAAAIAHLERALEIRTKSGHDPTTIADTKIELAAALWRPPPGPHRDRERARRVMAEARDVYAEAGVDAGVEHTETWLAEHP